MTNQKNETKIIDAMLGSEPAKGAKPAPRKRTTRRRSTSSKAASTSTLPELVLPASENQPDGPAEVVATQRKPRTRRESASRGSLPGPLATRGPPVRKRDAAAGRKSPLSV